MTNEERLARIAERKANREERDRRFPSARLGRDGEFFVTLEQGESLLLRVSASKHWKGWHADSRFPEHWMVNSMYFEIEELAEFAAAVCARLDYMIERLNQDVDKVNAVSAKRIPVARNQTKEVK